MPQLTVTSKNEMYAGIDLGKSADFTALVVFRKQMVDYGGSLPPSPESYRPIVLPLGTVITPAVKDAAKGEKPPKMLSRYDGWLVQRFDIGTAYTEIVERVTGLFTRPEMRGQTLVVDGTGVGEPVVDMFRKARRDPVKCPKCHGMGDAGAAACGVCVGQGRILLHAKVRPVYIKGGDIGSAVAVEERDGWRVSKRELVSILEVLLQWTEPTRLWFNPELRHAKALADELASFRVKRKAASVNETLEAWRERDHDDIVLACAIALWVAERGNRCFWIA